MTHTLSLTHAHVHSTPPCLRYVASEKKLVCGSSSGTTSLGVLPMNTNLMGDAADQIQLLNLVGCTLTPMSSFVLPDLQTVSASQSRLVVTNLVVNGSVRLLDQSWLQSSTSLQSPLVEVRAWASGGQPGAGGSTLCL